MNNKKRWKVIGDLVLDGIMAETKEQAIDIAKTICNEDLIQTAVFFEAVEITPCGHDPNAAGRFCLRCGSDLKK